MRDSAKMLRMETKTQQRNLPDSLKKRLALYRQKSQTGAVPRRDRWTVARGRSQAFMLRRAVATTAAGTDTRH